MSLLSRSLFPVDRPLLSHEEITALIDAGHRWSGTAAPWSIRETTFGRSGNLLSNLQGSGMDFAETRPYQPGDEPRHINWRATARSGKPMVRVFHEDLSVTSCFLVDRRASMRFATKVRLKAAQAARLAIFLAGWEMRRGAEIAGLVLDDSFRWLPARSGQSGLSQLSQVVTSACPPLPGLATISLEQTLSRLLQQLPGGSHIYILSDLLDVDEQLRPLLYRLGQVHRVWVFHIYDEVEQELPRAGALKLSWFQNGSKQISDTNNAAVRENYHGAFLNHQQTLQQLFRDADIPMTSTAADIDDLTAELGL